jgi:hypothetical protein
MSSQHPCGTAPGQGGASFRRALGKNPLRARPSPQQLVVFAKVFADLTAGSGRGALLRKRHGFAPSWGPGCRLWGRRPEGSLMEQNQVDAKDFFLA